MKAEVTMKNEYRNVSVPLSGLTSVNNNTLVGTLDAIMFPSPYRG